MRASKEFQERMAELLAPIGAVSVRRMFGGAGAFLDGVMFALIADDVLYFKTDDKTKDRFIAEDCEAFTYATSKGKRASMSYYEVPSRLLDENDEFIVWARDAIDVSRRAKKQKQAPKKKAASGHKK